MLGVSRLNAAPQQVQARLDPHHFHGLLERTASYLSPEDRVVEIASDDAIAAKLSDRTASYARFDNWDSYLRDHQPGTLDAVLIWYQLHRAGDVAKALRHCHGRLRAGGCLIALTPCVDGPDIAHAVARLLSRDKHTARMTPSGFERIVRSAGFEIHSCERFPRDTADILVVASKR